MLAVRDVLVSKHKLEASALSEIELICITLNSKCRIDEAAEKYMTYRDRLLVEYAIEDVWGDRSYLHDQWHRLPVAGLDEAGRQMMWVHGSGTQISEESRCIHASILYYFAVHADLHTLRNGISLIIDTSNTPKQKVGNEKKLQIAWQNFPTRAQGIYILGTTAITRIAVNAVIAFAALFAKNKVIARIRFAAHEQIAETMGNAAMPQMHGGEAKEETETWVNRRLAEFPLMGLPAYI